MRQGKRGYTVGIVFLFKWKEALNYAGLCERGRDGPLDWLFDGFPDFTIFSLI